MPNVKNVTELDLSHNFYNKYAGFLQIHHLDAEGKVLHITDAPNVITYGARSILTHLIAGDSLSNTYINSLEVGTDNTVPARTDTALGNKVDEVGITYEYPVIYPDRVVFTGILPNTTPANGSTLREAGLTNSNGELFARQVYGDIAKTAAVQLKYIWTIIFS
jgi:hypothetical protein